LRDSGGTGFWHETYFMRGGMEAIYDDMPRPVGFLNFAPCRLPGAHDFLPGAAPDSRLPFRRRPQA
jgi:hypothetical protein